MADYWKSQAKKYCDFCKCWIADNKPSVEFHEKGKRHKENVATRLSEMTKKSCIDHKNQLKVEDEMKKMEEAALKAYMKDVEASADYTSLVIQKKLAEKGKVQKDDTDVKPTDSRPKPNIPSTAGSSAKPKPKLVEKKWCEAKSNEGHTYYWHVHTGESCWEVPEEGFLSVSEQQDEEKTKATTEAEQRKIKADTARRKEEERARLAREKMKGRRVKETKPEPTYRTPITVGPVPRIDPYGAWNTVVTEVVKPLDLQLPHQEYVAVRVPGGTGKAPKLNFKEKTVSSLMEDSDDGLSNLSFKKRKFNSNPKRNMRQRLDPDD